MLDQKLIDFCNYVQPIVNGCAGFIKSDGFMTHVPGLIIMMSSDETYCSIIHIPVIHDVYLTSGINTFLFLKTPEDQSDLFRNTYFTGYNMKEANLKYYYSLYHDIDNKCKLLYQEPDCSNIPGFNEALGSSLISHVNVSNGNINYRIPASKSITQLTKSDSASLRLYECVYATNMDVFTSRYTVYKKKFNLNVDIYCNLIVV